MHVMTRSYTGKGAADLTKLLVSRKDEVEKLIGNVPGLVSYDLVETGDGCFTVTVCKDKAGTDSSLAVAKEWLKANAGHIGAPAPQVTEGKSALHISAKAGAHA